MSATVAWATLGVVLIIAEVFTGTFFLLFFGVSALIVSGLKLVGLNDLTWEMVLFGLVSVGGTFIFRNKVKAIMAKGDDFKSDTTLYLDQDIAPRSMGTVNYQGAAWTAVNDSDVPLKSGSRVQVVKTEGVKLFIKAGE